MTAPKTGEALRMTRLMPGLYAGENVRCERVTTGSGRAVWRFEIKGRALGGKLWWIEYHAFGNWMPIGGWRTRAGGVYVAERLVAGTHFWDGELKRCRLYNDEVYAEIRAMQEFGR